MQRRVLECHGRVAHVVVRTKQGVQGVLGAEHRSRRLFLMVENSLERFESSHGDECERQDKLVVSKM